MIGIVGINYKSAPLSIRERFSFTSEQIVEFGQVLKQKSGFNSVIILSTCNRSEIYFQMEECCDKSAFSYILTSLKQYRNISENIRQYFYLKIDDEAYSHLFRVVSGLNSMVLGENQIVGQVKQAYRYSADAGLIDCELDRLFSKSLEAGKKIRTETKLNQGAFSVSYAGIEKCLSVFPDITKRSILLVGAGETGELTLKTLIKKGCENILITNRTLDRSQKLAKKYNVKAGAYEELENLLLISDIVLVSTASQSFIIHKEQVERVNRNRGDDKQLYIDLSVPRNVAHEVSEIKNVQVFDVDDLQEVVDSNQENRKKLTLQAEVIIGDYLEEFRNWISSRNLSLVISRIKTNFNDVNHAELAGFKKINKAEENPLIDHYGKHITDKYTRLLIKNLKEVTNNGRKQEYIKMLTELFELN